jgi:hypothetical protein
MKLTNHQNYKRQQLTYSASLKIVRKRLSLFAIAIIVLAIGVAVTVAFAVTPVDGGNVGGTTIVVDNTGGDQLDPHVSGDLAAYTDSADPSAPVIRYYDFLNPAAPNPNPAITGGIGDEDRLSDVNGDHIAFARNNNGFNSHACMVFDVVSHNTITIATGTSIGATALGSDTVAFIGSGDLWAGSISGSSLTNLSASSNVEKTPAVSPSGTLVVWASCPTLFSPCDIMKATLSGGVWSAPAVVASAPAANPDTDGANVVYDSAGDIFFQPAGGGAATQLVIDGVQLNPSIAGGVITFASSVDGISPADLFVYQISTNTLFRVTDTPGISETLNDVTVLDGDVRVVWAANDDPSGIGGNLNNIYARTFTLPQQPPPVPSYQVCLLYDPLMARKSGTTYPIKLQLCDSNGQNLSSPSIVLHAISVTQASTNAPGPLDDTGNANPDFDFRYDATLGGTGGYIFNLSLRGAPTGTYNLNFRAGTDPALHSAPFAVK